MAGSIWIRSRLPPSLVLTSSLPARRYTAQTTPGRQSRPCVLRLETACAEHVSSGGIQIEAGTVGEFEGQYELAMQRALALAETVRGRTSPNPAVGAVVLDAG